MKNLPIAMSLFLTPARRRNLRALVRLLIAFAVTVALFTVIFHFLMAYEEQSHSWSTGFYWVMVVMSTLGFGDITFKSDVGRLFSVVVLLTGSVYMMVLLPFMFIQFFYIPWMEAQAALRAPTELPKTLSRHVLLTGLGSVERSLIRLLNRSGIPYAILVADLTEALRLHDEGFSVMVGEIDDRETYRHARADQAALVVASQRDTTNTNIAFTVREFSDQVAIVVTASAAASVDILQLAGANHVLELAESLGKALARRVVGRDARAHVIGRFDEVLVAEAAVHGTPLAGHTVAEAPLGNMARVNVLGIWNRGEFNLARPDTRLDSSSVLLLSGDRAAFDDYNDRYAVVRPEAGPVVIIGCGRVGRAVARELARKGHDYRLVDKNPDRIRDRSRAVIGDASELEILEQAGIHTCASIVITTHDDDVNIYLAIYCRKLRPDIQILVRANQDRNVSTLHRSGADFVLSYASTGAGTIFNLLRRGDLVLVAEGFDVFRVPVPKSLVGKTLAQSGLRATTGCNVVAIVQEGKCRGVPDPHLPLGSGMELILVGDTEDERRFYDLLV